jgi:hypothetical protein
LNFSPTIQFFFSAVFAFCKVLSNKLNSGNREREDRYRYCRDNARTSPKVSDDNCAYQIPLPSFDRSSRCSNLSRALCPEHANESAGFCSGGPPSVSRESAVVPILFILELCRSCCLQHSYPFEPLKFS